MRCRMEFLLPLVLILVSLGVLSGCSNQHPHNRLGWKAEDFFTDKGVIALCKAIEKKDVAEIDRLVKSGVNINAKGRGNMTPLLWAFPMGEEVFKKVLDLGADPNVTLSEDFLLLKGKSVVFASVELADGPMHYEYFRDVPMENYLSLVLDHGGNPNAEDPNKETPLFCIAHRCPNVEKKMIRLLAGAGANINHRNYNASTALIRSVGRAGHVLSLLETGADYRLCDDLGWDFVIRLQREKDSLESDLRKYPNNALSTGQLPALKPVFAWLADEGVNWQAARKALDSPETMANLKNLPADYKHRPWLPQRPTLKKPDAKANAEK
jgi:hypothetical protein